ncbi:GNAT family N-acetyltransferase [Stetteria hydrogenophila]
MGLEVRPLRDPSEFAEAVEVQRLAWGMSDYRDAAPPHLLRALADNGGLVLGAFLDGRLVGVSYGWFVGSPGDGYFYSHATGVAEGVKYRGVGYALKLEQRRRVLERGYRLIKWTFDPLQSLNSNFNLAKLGVVVRVYVPNYYGEMRDSINEGLASDRAKAEWYIDSERVRLKLEGKLKAAPAEAILEAGGAVALERRVEGGLEAPGEPRLGLDAPAVLVALPRSISSLRDRDPGLAARWRLATRSVYSHYLSRGYLMVDYTRDSSGGGYVVLARDPMEPVVYQATPSSSP